MIKNKFLVLLSTIILVLSGCEAAPKPLLNPVDSNSIRYNFTSSILSWDSVENATSYTISIVSSPSATYTSNIPSYYYPTTSSFQVRIKSNANNDFSESLLSSMVNIYFLNAPTNLRIDDGALRWDLIPNAVSYEVLEENSGIPTIVTSNVFTAINSGVDLSFKVRAVGNSTRIKTSPYSSALRFTLLDSPQDLDFNKGSNLLTWSPVNGAEGYKIIINDEENAQGTTNTTYSFTPGPRTYEIKVIATSEGSNLVNSKPSIINLVRLPSVSLSSVAITEKDTGETFISFNPVNLNPNPSISYKVMVNGFQLQGVEAIDGKVEVGYTFNEGDSTISITAVAPTTASISSNGIKTYYFDSIPADFSTNKLTSPTNLKIEDDTFKWDSVPNASSYGISFSGSEVFSTNDTSYSFASQPNEGGNFTAKVKSIGNQGSFISSNFSQELPFRVLPKILISSFTFNNDILQWASVQGATSYLVYINENTPLSSNTNSINLQSSSANNFRIQIKALGNGSLNILGSLLSDPYIINRLNKPLNYQLNVNGVLTWNSVENARRYVINLNNEILYSDITSYDLTNKVGPEDQFVVFVYAEANQTSPNPRLNSNPTDIISGRRLARPSNIRIDTSDRSIIRWDPVQNANAYQISINGNTSTVQPSSNPFFTPNLTSSNPTNTFTVRALANTQSISNEYFINSPISSTFQFQSAKLNTPSQPTVRPKTVDSISFLEISYSAVSNASSYQVNIGGISNPTDQTTFLYSYPNAGTYDVYVTAIGNGTEFVNSSNSLTRTIKILGQTTVTRSSSGNNWIIRWTAIPDANGYRVLRKSINNTTGQEENTVINLSNVFTQADVIVPTGFTYQYQIIVLGDGVNTFDSAVSNTIVIP
jgi:hypothetical protein